MQDAQPNQPTVRLNLRALVLLTVCLAVVTVVAIGIHFVQSARLRTVALNTVRSQIDDGKADLALKNLEELSRSYPDDLEIFEMKTKLLASSARTLEQLLHAASINDQFVRANPDAPGAQDARRRTVELFLLFGELYRESSYYRALPELTIFNARDRGALAVAKELIDRGAHDAGAYFLLAEAEERTGQGRDAQKIDDAIRDYRRALRVDPTHLLAAERLANLLADRKGERLAAIWVLDRLSKSRRDSPELRLVRHRFFRKIGDEARASAELDAALRIAPSNLAVSLEAAELAIRRGRISEARRFVSRIPVSQRNDLRVRLVLGLIEFQENHPDAGLEVWRKGLISSQGTDAMLTWNLAYSLLQLGRLEEAAPLVDQYRRLIGDSTSPMLNLLLAIQEQKSGHSLKAVHLLEEVRAQIDPRWSQLVDYTLGQSYVVTGDMEKSLVAYRRVLEENPRSAAVRVDLAEGLLSTRPREAVELIDAGLRSLPNDPALCLARASALLRIQEETPPTARTWASYDQAIKKAAEVAPKHWKLALILSRRAVLESQIDEAIALLDEAIGHDPRKSKLWESYVETLLKAGRANQALGILQRASGPDAIGDTVGIRLARFRVLEHLGRAREGREQLVKDVDRFQPDQQAAIRVVQCADLVSRGQASAALNVYVEWARQIPEDVRPRQAMLEMAMYGASEISGAASDALRSLGDSEDVSTKLDKARELIRDDDLQNASQKLDEVRAKTQNLAALDALQGELFEHQLLIGDATSAYRRAWKAGSEGAMNRLVALLARENPAELERMSLTNGSPQLIRAAAQAFFQSGQSERAIRLISSDPSASETSEMLAWRTELLNRLGKSGRTEAIVRAEISRRAETAEPWMALLRYQTKHRDPAAVIASFKEAKEAIKDERTDFTDARLSWAAGDRDRADRGFRSCIAARPDDVEILLVASDFYQEAGRPSEVEALLRRALVLKPELRKASRKLALLLLDRPFDQAGWERAWTLLGPESSAAEEPEDRMVRAILLSKGPTAEHRQRATEVLELLVADLPTNTKTAARASLLLTRLLLDTGQGERAAQVIGPRVEQNAGSDPIELALLAEALLQSGRYEQAASELDRLAKLDPNDVREVRLRARLIAARAVPGEAADDLERAYLALGQSPRARAFGREAFALLAYAKPKVDEVAERLGRTLAARDPGLSWLPAMIVGRNGQPTEALRLCQVAAGLADPADARETCRVAVGIAAADPKVDHRNELEAILEAASQRDPDGTDIPLQLAQLRHRQGRFEDAVRLYRTVIERRPDLRASIQNNMAWILSEELKRPNEAITVADELVNTQGRIAAVLDTRGVILTRLGRTAEAIKDLEESNRSVVNPAHLFHLARAYRAAGRIEDFQRCRNLAIRAGLTSAVVEPSEQAELAALLRP